jgi:hypothetical protein
MRCRENLAHGAQIGIPENGNIKPDNKIEGSKVNRAICIACIWLVAIVDKVKARADYWR